MPRLVQTIFERNRLLATMGTVLFALALLLALYLPFNKVQVLHINSLIKPIKFCLSTGIYAYTFAYLLHYLENQKAVRRFSILATVVIVYENGVIIIQAFRGKLSHFNQTELLGGILYALMGIMIVWVTLATVLITIRFIFQKTQKIPAPFALSIKLGLVIFIIFSFMGGYMSAINSHLVGGPIGQEAGLPFLNWSTIFGDLRVAHFFGIHALQLLPLFGYWLSGKQLSISLSKAYVWLFAAVYFVWLCYVLWQALQKTPFIS